MTDPKQEIYDILYQFEGHESVLDVGCGADNGQLESMPAYTGIDMCFGDIWGWYNFKPSYYDIIIANDLFPNVDQRLELFLDKYLPHCREMRLSLTYFDEPKWYRATRPEGEVVTMLAWDWERLTQCLIKSEISDDVVIKYFDYSGTFPNGRKVLLVWLKGGLA